MHLLTRPRSRHSPSPTNTTTSQMHPSLSPPLSPLSPLSSLSSPPPLPPKPQPLKFFRTFSPRPLPTSDTCGSNAREVSPRTAARALRGWFGSPLSPSSGKTEDEEEYKWRYLEQEKEREAFLRSLEDEGGYRCSVPLPRSPASPRRAGEEEEKERRRRRRRRGDSKSSDFDTAMLAHARSLGYSCPSSPSELGSNGSVESLASGSSGWSSAHSPKMSVLSPSIRGATHYRPTTRHHSSSLPSSPLSYYSYGGGEGRETKPPIASEDFVAGYFAGDGPAEGSMLEGFRRASKPKVVDVPRQSGAQSPEQQQQNALQLEVETRPQRATEILSPGGTAEPTFAPVPVSSSRTTSMTSSTAEQPPSFPLRSPRGTVLVFRPPSPAPRRHACSPTPHRTFRPSPLGARTLSLAGHDDTERCENPPTDLDALRVWNRKRRRHTTDGLTTIWETGSHTESF